MKSLTVIVPIYNLERYIGKCLGSVPVETGEVEVLVILDGSEDRSAEIAREYERQFPSVFKVVEKENGQYGSCVNTGLSLASGRYVKILDGDDSFTDNAEDFVSFLQGCDTDVIFSEWLSVNERGDTIVRSSVRLPVDKDLEMKDLVSHGEFRIHHFFLAYKTQFLRSIGYRQSEGLSYTDLEWNTIPFAFVRSIKYYPKAIYRYLRGREGQTVGMEYRSKNMWMENKVVLNLVKYYEENKDKIPEPNAVFLQSEIRFFIIRIYKHYLILYPHSLKLSELAEFDKELNSNSTFFYRLVEDDVHKRKYGRFKYIKVFRKHFSRNGIPFLYLDLCMKLRKVIKGSR